MEEKEQVPIDTVTAGSANKPNYVEKRTSEDSYKANPRQFVYDIFHENDFEIHVTDVFFGEEEKKTRWNKEVGLYTVKSGGTIKNVLDKYKKKGRRNIKTEPDRKLAEQVQKDEVIKVVWEEEEAYIEYKKINSAELGEEVYVVAICSGQEGKLKIKLKEELSADPKVMDDPVKFLIDGKEQTEVVFDIKPSTPSFTYYQKIQIRPKDDTKYKEISKKVKARQDKKVHIYLKAKVTDTKDSVVWGFMHIPYFDAVEGTMVVDYVRGDKDKFEITEVKLIIVTDAGHGINGDGGNVYTSNPDTEAIMTLLLETKTSNKLKELGFKVKRTRTTDSLKVNERQVTYRVNFAKKEKAQIFISFHLDYVPLNKDGTIKKESAEFTNKIGINLHPKVLKGKSGNTISGGASDKFYENSNKLIDYIIPELKKIFTTRKIVKINATRPNVSHDYIGVLKGMDKPENAATLIEFGNTTFENTKFLKDNADKIGNALAFAIENYANSI